MSAGIVTDPVIEDLLTAQRRQILFDAVQAEARGGDRERTALAVDLNLQCHLNEFIWSFDAEERRLCAQLLQDIDARLARDGSCATVEIAIAGAYGSYDSLSEASTNELLRRADDDAELARLVRRRFIEPRREAEIARKLSRLTVIDDSTSQSVRRQYEEHPFPRWTEAARYQSVPYMDHIGYEIHPNSADYDEAGAHPTILIAGCGTGLQAISAATRYANASVTAVDLSRASLAYATRKAEEYGLENLSFGQADILHLPDCGLRYDVIECSGVLHHMKAPEAGLNALLQCLKPGGFLKLGLYSRTARLGVEKARALVRSEGWGGNPDDIRRCREAMKKSDDPAYDPLKRSIDFYAMSQMRDLIFHVQECAYDLSDVADLLSRAGLSFLGFYFASAAVKEAYRHRFPHDVAATSLENWAVLEGQENRLFQGMYEFWTRYDGA